jgi:hypothetical protein
LLFFALWNAWAASEADRHLGIRPVRLSGQRVRADNCRCSPTPGEEAMDNAHETATLKTWEELRWFVLEKLCAQDGLDPQQAQLLEQPLRRQGQLAGVLFELRGPRRLRTQAIWACPDRRIYLYNSAGERTAVVRLTAWPKLKDEAA